MKKTPPISALSIFYSPRSEKFTNISELLSLSGLPTAYRLLSSWKQVLTFVKRKHILIFTLFKWLFQSPRTILHLLTLNFVITTDTLEYRIHSSQDTEKLKVWYIRLISKYYVYLWIGCNETHPTVKSLRYLIGQWVFFTRIFSMFAFFLDGLFI